MVKAAILLFKIRQNVRKMPSPVGLCKSIVTKLSHNFYTYTHTHDFTLNQNILPSGSVKDTP